MLLVVDASVVIAALVKKDSDGAWAERVAPPGLLCDLRIRA